MATVKSFLKKAKEIEAEDGHRKVSQSRKDHQSAHDESSWLVSYADMMTLLCGFFIMMFSLATLEPSKAKKMKEELAEGFTPSAPASQIETDQNVELAKYVTQILQEAGIASEAMVRTDPLGVAVVFQSTLFFDTLSAEVRLQGQEVLNKLIDGLYKRQTGDRKNYRVVVEGHTDSRPVIGGPYPSNWELSGSRAARVVRMFLNRGFDATQLVAIGYADTRPEAPSRTPAGTYDEAALAKNRRVVIRVLQTRSEFIPLPQPAPEAAPPASAALKRATASDTPPAKPAG